VNGNGRKNKDNLP